MGNEYDYIVVGVGGIGSATLYWLTKLAPNANILGIEQFELGHVRGGSQDVSRITRKMYGSREMTDFAQDVYESWHEIERESGLELIYKCGGLFWTTEDTGRLHTVEEWKTSMSGSGIPVEFLTGDQIQTRWPQIQLEDGLRAAGVVDVDGGLVDAAMANAAHQQTALRRHAQIIDNCPVNRLQTADKRADGKIKVETEKGDFLCKKVIITAGAWVNQLINPLNANIPVKVSQENVTYFATPHLKEFTKEKFPVFIYCDEGFDMYGLPIHGIPGFKLGIDAGGHPVTGDSRTWDVDPIREKLCKSFIKRFMPKAMGRVIETRVCLYTMTLDRTFVIDTLHRVNQPNVIVCCGAGHAFKFAAKLGKILSELAIEGHTGTDLSAFSMDRPAITDPNFEPNFHMIQKENSSKI